MDLIIYVNLVIALAGMDVVIDVNLIIILT